MLVAGPRNEGGAENPRAVAGVRLEHTAVINTVEGADADIWEKALDPEHPHVAICLEVIPVCAAAVRVGSGVFGFSVVEIRRCCFSPWGVAFQRTTRRRWLELLNLSPTRLFCQKTVNAIAQ